MHGTWHQVLFACPAVRSSTGRTRLRRRDLSYHLFVNYNGAYTDTGAVYDEFGYFVYRTHPYAPEYEGVNYFAIYLPEDDD